MKKGSEVWTRNDDGTITFKVVKTASTTLIQEDKVAVQVTFQHKPSNDPDFQPESVQFILPVSAAKELASYIQQFTEITDATDTANQTIH